MQQVNGNLKLREIEGIVIVDSSANQGKTQGLKVITVNVSFDQLGISSDRKSPAEIVDKSAGIRLILKNTAAKKVVNSTEAVAEEVKKVNKPSKSVSPSSKDYLFFKKKYKETALLQKIVNNYGNGYSDLYGTRNVQPILYGLAYRGGANNYYHNTNKRNNHNPLPQDGLENLCKEGFSSSVYLYRTNFETSPPEVSSGGNNMKYYQYDYFDTDHVKEMLKLVHDNMTKEYKGPVYYHCWNGWHASGFIAAVILKQFCKYSNFDAVNYWDLGTDGANLSPRYNKIRNQIRAFEPYPEFNISDSLSKCYCPPMPSNVDSSKLHLGLEHLTIVPEAIPVGYSIALNNLQFATGSANINNPGNEDLVKLIKALKTNPEVEVEIGGHTDKTGNEKVNRELSEMRAKAIYDYLLDNDVSPMRLSYKGYGSAKPLLSNKYKYGRSVNRRIEVKVLSHSTLKNSGTNGRMWIDDEN